MLAAFVIAGPVPLLRRVPSGDIYLTGHGVYRRPGRYVTLDPNQYLRLDSVEVVDRPRPHSSLLRLTS
jgi:hypothetical protein